MAERRRRSPKPLRRTTGVRPPRKTLLVFCEGARTEPEYLEALRREPAVRETAAVDIRIDADSAGFTPLGLVRRAIAARSKALAEDGEIDEFWCVFDVEWPKNHPGLVEAKSWLTATGYASLFRTHASRSGSSCIFPGTKDGSTTMKLGGYDASTTAGRTRVSIRLVTCRVDGPPLIVPPASINGMLGTAPPSHTTTRPQVCIG